jgi:hypothetical protein
MYFRRFLHASRVKKSKVSVAVAFCLTINLMFICYSILSACDRLRNPPKMFFTRRYLGVAERDLFCDCRWFCRTYWPEFTCVVGGQGRYMHVRSRYLVATPHSALISRSLSVGQESMRHQPVCSVNRINPWYQIEVLSKSRVFAPYRSNLSFVNSFFFLQISFR